MYFTKSITLKMWIVLAFRRKLGDFTRAEQCKCEFYANWVLWRWMLWDELFECEFHESWVLLMWIKNWTLQMWTYESRAGHCECELCENLNWDCTCELSDSWALQMLILWELSFDNVNFSRAKHCEWEYIKVLWALWMWM